MQKTADRLQNFVRNSGYNSNTSINFRPNDYSSTSPGNEREQKQETSTDSEHNSDPSYLNFRCLNFRNITTFLREEAMMGRVDCHLADLGVSSMQIDNTTRGFSYKHNADLDMRMDVTNTDIETAFSYLNRVKLSTLVKVLQDNSDEIMAPSIAAALLGMPSKATKLTSNRKAGAGTRNGNRSGPIKVSNKAQRAAQPIRNVPKTTYEFRGCYTVYLMRCIRSVVFY